jgi:hypothetical protein
VTHEPRSVLRSGRQIVSNVLFLAGIGTAVAVLGPFYAAASLTRRVGASIRTPHRLGLHGSAGR